MEKLKLSCVELDYKTKEHVKHSYIEGLLKHKTNKNSLYGTKLIT